MTDDATQRLREQRAAQGLPERLEDVDAIDRIVVILAGKRAGDAA